MANEQLKDIVLEQDAWFQGRRVRKGMTVQATPEAVEAAYKEGKRTAIRNRLNATAGDAQTLLGTNIDLTHMLLVEFGKMLEAAKGSKDPALAKYASDALGRIGSATKAKFPFQKKGEAEVLDDVVKRGNATTAVLAGDAAVEVTSGSLSPAEDVSKEKPKAAYRSPMTEQDDRRFEESQAAMATDPVLIGTVPAVSK